MATKHSTFHNYFTKTRQVLQLKRNINFHIPQLEWEPQADQHGVGTVPLRVVASQSHDPGRPWLRFAPLEDERTSLLKLVEDQREN